MTSKIIDIHTHLDKNSKLSLVEALNSHGILSEYICTYLKFQNKINEFKELSDFERARVIYQTMFIDNGPISKEAVGVAFVIDRFTNMSFENDYTLRPDKINDFEALSNFFDRLNDPEVLGREKILQKTDIGTLFMSNYPLDDLESDDKFKRVIRTHAFETNEIFQNKFKPEMIAISISGDDFIDCDYIAKLIKNYNVPIHIFFGAERDVNDKIKSIHQDLGEGIPLESNKRELRKLKRLLCVFDNHKFILSNMIESLEMEFISLAKNFPNVILAGFWWQMSSPELMKKYLRIRIQELGYNFIPFFSDAKNYFQLWYRWNNFERIFRDAILENSQFNYALNGREESIKQIINFTNKALRGI